MYLLSSGGYVATQRKKEVRGPPIINLGIIKYSTVRFLAKTALKAEGQLLVDLTLNQS